MITILKIISFALLAIAMTTFTGIVHFSYAQPAETLLSFVFLSVKTAFSHGISGVIIAVVVFYFFKKSIQLLLTATLLLAGLAGILFYIY